MKISISEEKIRMINVRNSIKTLGMCIIPSLRWINEHECVERNMKSSIKKLTKVDMMLNQVHLCFNTCMLTNVFFGCGIVKFTKKQWDKLKKTYELLIVRKMGLGDNFPRKLLNVKNQC